MVQRGRLSGKNEIEVRVREILKKYRIGKHFETDIRDDGFNFKVNEEELIDEVTAKSKGDQALIKKRLERSRRHIESIDKQLVNLSQKVDKGQLHGQDKIGVRVGKVYQQVQGLASISSSTFVTTISALISIKTMSKKRLHLTESTSYEPACPKRE